MTHLLCSTGAISRNPDYTSYRQVLQYAPYLNLDGFELMFYETWYPHIAQIAEDLQAASLSFPVMHTEKNIGVALGSSEPKVREQGVQWLAENCRLAHLLHTQVLVLHLWGWPQLDDNLQYNLAPLSRCLDIATHYNLKLAIETIPARHADPLTNVRRAFECDQRCYIALDTEFLAQYHQLESVFETGWLWQNERVQHIHIKDYDGHPFQDGKRRYVHPSDGNIDFEHFFAHLKERGFNGALSLESPSIDANGKVDIKKLNKSLNLIRHYLQSSTREL